MPGPLIAKPQTSNYGLPDWLVQLIQDPMPVPLSTSIVSGPAKAVAGGGGKALMSAIQGELFGGPKNRMAMPPMAEAPRTSGGGATAMDLAEQPSLFSKMQAMMPEMPKMGGEAPRMGGADINKVMGQLDLPLEPGGFTQKGGGPLFELPQQSPVGKSPFKDMGGPQKQLPLGKGGTGPATTWEGRGMPYDPNRPLGPGGGKPINGGSAMGATPTTSPVGNAVAGPLKNGMSRRMKMGLGAAGIGATVGGIDLVNYLRGGKSAPTPTGGGGGMGRQVAPTPEIPPEMDWSQLMSALGGQQGQPGMAPPGGQNPMMQAAMQQQGKQGGQGFDWKQLLNFLPALMVAIAMSRK